MLMKELAEKKAANYSAHVAHEKETEKNLTAIKQGFHIRALIKNVAK